MTFCHTGTVCPNLVKYSSVFPCWLGGIYKVYMFWQDTYVQMLIRWAKVSGSYNLLKTGKVQSWVHLQKKVAENLGLETFKHKFRKYKNNKRCVFWEALVSFLDLSMLVSVFQHFFFHVSPMMLLLWELFFRIYIILKRDILPPSLSCSLILLLSSVFLCLGSTHTHWLSATCTQPAMHNPS